MNGEREVNIGVLVRQKGGFPQEEDGLGGHRGVGEYFLVESSRLGVRLAERTLTDCQLVGEDAGQNRRHSWVRVPVHAPVAECSPPLNQTLEFGGQLVVLESDMSG